MAMVITVAMVVIMATITKPDLVKYMHNNKLHNKKRSVELGQKAELILADIFAKAHWQVRQAARGRAGAPIPDMIVRRRDVVYVVEVKAAAEGRRDRLVPLWSQAYLQALRAAGDQHPPLAVVAAPRIARRVAEQVFRFVEEYAPAAAAGVIDFEGLRFFRGPQLEGLNSADSNVPLHFRSVRSEPSNLFSDLNQWMLKVLLAPEVPDGLLSAPRARYRNASQLAHAASVGVMSAFRLVQLLRQEGFLADSEPYLRLVRRAELFERWQSSMPHRARELPMRFLLRASPGDELQRILGSGRACLALFAAADALGLGFVHGVPPHVYVRSLHQAGLAEWKGVVPAVNGERPDLILRQVPAVQSVFRGLVRVDGRSVCDVLQVWLDVYASPSRGREQADLIRRKLLNPVIIGA